MNLHVQHRCHLHFFCNAYWTNQLAVSLLTDWSTRGRVISPTMNFKKIMEILLHVLLLLIKYFKAP